MEARDNLEICESRIRLVLFSIGAIVLFLGALGMFGSTLGAFLGLFGRPLIPHDYPAMIIAMLLGAAGVVLFGLTSVQAAPRMFRSSMPVVLISGNGFKDVRISNEWIPWPAILSVKDPRSCKGERGFFVEVDPEFRAKLHLSFTSCFVRWGNRLFGYKGLWVVTQTLRALPAGTLFDVMRSRLAGASASA